MAPRWLDIGALEGRALTGLERLKGKALEVDQQVSALAGLARLQAETAGKERNREMLQKGSSDEVMTRLMAERRINPGSAAEQQHRDAIAAGGTEREKKLAPYRDDLNRGPAGITKMGVGEGLAALMEQHQLARVAGIYAPVGVMSAAGLTAAGRGLLDLIASRENAVATLGELEQAAAAARAAEESEGAA